MPLMMQLLQCCQPCGDVVLLAVDVKLSSLLTKEKTSQTFPELCDSVVKSTKLSRLIYSQKEKRIAFQKCAFLKYLDGFQALQWHMWFKGNNTAAVGSVSYDASSMISATMYKVEFYWEFFYTWCNSFQIMFFCVQDTQYQWNTAHYIMETPTVH